MRTQFRRVCIPSRMRCRPVGRPATQYTKVRIREREKKTGMSRSRRRNYCFQLLPLLPEYFTASEWLSRVPRASYTNTRERMTTGWFPLT